MAIWLDPTGHTNYGIAICDRCKKKMYMDELRPDPNTPGLRVCCGCRDQFDPWRLPPRQTEKITLPFVRPDVPVSTDTGDYTVDDRGDLQPNTGFTPGV